jgi:hypothetical protein
MLVMPKPDYAMIRAILQFVHSPLYFGAPLSSLYTGIRHWGYSLLFISRNGLATQSAEACPFERLVRTCLVRGPVSRSASSSRIFG